MLKEEKFIIAEYKGIKVNQSDSVKLRGFFAKMDYGSSYMHNHGDEGESIYRYPQVQYKVINHHPLIVAYGEGAKSLYPKLLEADSIRIGRTVYESPEISLRRETHKIGDADGFITYAFLTPWLGLNQNNYKKYLAATNEEKIKLLERVLIGNILSLGLGFDVILNNKLEVFAQLEEVGVKFKGESMIGFIGEFQVNAHLPSLCGIGKGVSRGMGTIIMQENKTSKSIFELF